MAEKRQAFSCSINLFIPSKLAAAGGFCGSGSSSEQSAAGWSGESSWSGEQEPQERGCWLSPTLGRALCLCRAAEDQIFAPRKIGRFLPPDEPHSQQGSQWDAETWGTKDGESVSTVNHHIHGPLFPLPTGFSYPLVSPGPPELLATI